MPWPALAGAAQGQRCTWTSREKHKTRHVRLPERGNAWGARPRRSAAWGPYVARVDPGAVARGVQEPRGPGTAREGQWLARDPRRLARGGARGPRRPGRAGAGAAGRRWEGREGGGGGRFARAARGQSAGRCHAGRWPSEDLGQEPGRRGARSRTARPEFGCGGAARPSPRPALSPSLRPASCPAPSLRGCGAALPAHSEPGGDREAEAGRPWVRVRELSQARGPKFARASGGRRGRPGRSQPVLASSPGSCWHPGGRKPRPGQLRGRDAVPGT